MNEHRMTMRFEATQYAQIARAAKELGLSVAAFIRMVVNERLRAERERRKQGDG